MKLYENSRLKKYCKNNVIISTNIKIFFQKIFQEDKYIEEFSNYFIWNFHESNVSNNLKFMLQFVETENQISYVVHAEYFHEHQQSSFHFRV